MSMNLLKSISVIGALLVLTSCHQISRGVVVGKNVDPAHVETTFMYIGDGKTSTLIPITIYYPESYRLEVKGYNKHGEERVESFYVDSSKEFSTIRIGDLFACGESKDCVRDRPQTERGGK